MCSYSKLVGYFLERLGLFGEGGVRWGGELGGGIDGDDSGAVVGEEGHTLSGFGQTRSLQSGGQNSLIFS